MECSVANSYTIGDQLGWGSFSRVYQGTHVEDGEEVAIKLISKTNEQIDEHKQRLSVTIEVEAMARIEHENVLKIIGIDWDAQTDVHGFEDSCFAIVTEVAKGGLLFDVMSKSRFTHQDIVRTHFAQLVAGLSACHEAGVAHRDLSRAFSDNVLIRCRT